MDRGDNEVGPYQSPMENSIQRFHEWYRNEMKFEGADGCTARACSWSAATLLFSLMGVCVKLASA